MDKIEAKAKVILPSNTNNKSLINVGSAIDKTNSNTNSLNNDKTTPNRNGEIIVLHRFSEERVISLTILSILSLILISITISFIYIYIFKKYFRQILSLLSDTSANTVSLHGYLFDIYCSFFNILREFARSIFMTMFWQ